MFTLAKLVFKSYMPLQLEKGMWFASKQKDIVYGKVYEYLKLYELTHVPQDMDSYIAINGAPVEPYIVQPMQNLDEPEQILATPDQIGWWDEGETSDDLEDITIQIINSYIYGENGENGDIALEMQEFQDDESGEIYRSLVLFYGKVTIRHVSFVDEDEWDDDDEWEDDWDEDDLTDDDPDYDSAGFTSDDRIVEGQYKATLKQDEQRYSDRHKQDSCPKHDADHETE